MGKSLREAYLGGDRRLFPSQTRAPARESLEKEGLETFSIRVLLRDVLGPFSKGVGRHFPELSCTFGLMYGPGWCIERL